MVFLRVSSWLFNGFLRVFYGFFHGVDGPGAHIEVKIKHFFVVFDGVL